MLSEAKHLAFSVDYKDEILRLSPQGDIKTQSREGEKEVNSGKLEERFVFVRGRETIRITGPSLS
jgi:hypothetical protein